MRILSFDIESTTGSHNDGSMCTFGYCLADYNFNITSQKDIVMRPHTKRIESKIKLHYDKAQIKSSPQFPYFYNEIKELFKNCFCIIGFSIMNDVDFLNNACEIYMLDKIEYEFLDVQLIYKTVYKRPTLSALSSIAEELGIEYQAHRSDEDARVTSLVLKHILNDTKLSLSELLKKYHITHGVNNNTEISPCQNGVFTHKEINYLVLEFVKANYKHKRYYRGGLSSKTFAFSDNLKYDDVDRFRQIIKRIYDLNGRIGSIESSNVLVCDKENITEKIARQLEERNRNKERIKVISTEEFFKMIGELPTLDFSGDIALLRAHRNEVKRLRKLRKQEEGKIMVNGKKPFNKQYKNTDSK